MKRTVSEEVKPKAGKFWKITGQVILYTFLAVAVLAWVKQEVNLDNFSAWWNPFYVREVKSEPVATAPTIDDLLKAVNAERSKAGVAPLKIDARLNQSAQFKADDMKKRGYFDHVDPNGKNGANYVFDFAPKVCAFANENITDSGEPEYNTTEAGVKAWVDSKPHYEAMIDPDYDLTGFGITSTGLVQHFCQLP